jgi:hypothetical protein
MAAAPVISCEACGRVFFRIFPVHIIYESGFLGLGYIIVFHYCMGEWHLAFHATFAFPFYE